MQAPRSRILLVEDHEDTRELVAYVLIDSNYLVDTTSTIEAAVQLVQSQNYNLLIFDSMLPDGSGLELCKLVRKFDQLTPIVFYSGLACEKDKISALDAGAQGYLVKPVNIDELVGLVRDLLDKAPALKGSEEIVRDSPPDQKPLVAAVRS
jgi:two-component system, OmpR family, copper resistance phosphate regulon response regulator CusR